MTDDDKALLSTQPRRCKTSTTSTTPTTIKEHTDYD